VSSSRPTSETGSVHPLLQGLNSVQREAVEFGDGPLLLFAGAGSGKTRVLTHRVAYLVAVRKVSPWSILAVTFTNKAAKEMKERIGKLVGENVGRHMWVGTFHATCARLLRENGESIGIKRDFTVFDDGDQLTVIKDCLRRLNIDDKKFTPRTILSHISQAKEKLIPPERWHEHFFGFFEEICGRVYPLYQEILRQNNGLDFDDLLTETVRMLESAPDVLRQLQERYRYILVDEYQDVNHVQYVLLKRLAARHRNICVVGDDDQSIYLWRGADVRIILEFERDYPDAKVLKLEQNYRSTKTILEAAHGVVSKNVGRKDKRLWTEKPDGAPLTLLEAENEQEEAVAIVRRITAEVRAGRSWSDFAVLYRTNAQSRVLEEMFLNWNAPHKIVGGVRFYERKEIKDVIAYLRAIHNPADSVSLRRILNVPTRGIGAATLTVLEQQTDACDGSLWAVLERAEGLDVLQPRARARLTEFARMIAGLRAEIERTSVTEITSLVLERSGYVAALKEEKTVEAQTRLENVLELLSVTREYEKQSESPGLTGFLEEVALVADIDALDESAEAVTLMTLHAAKGLEFPVVFITGMEEGLLPHIRSIEEPKQLEEERRLCYVGITRAQEELTLSYAQRRSQFGSVACNMPSRFLTEIPSELFATSAKKSVRPPVVSSFDPDADARSASRGDSRHSRDGRRLWTEGPVSPREERAVEAAGGIKVGKKVRHAVFGVGVVLNIKGEGANTTAEVVFANVGPKKLLLSYANLEIVP
jgi:DNA helicase-2/ATP-dependent DNA helicase PcrA